MTPARESRTADGDDGREHDARDARLTLPTLTPGECDGAELESRPQSPGEDGSLPRELDEYQLGELIGEGAMGQVFRARDTLLDRDVAIKFITRPGEPWRERLLGEARAAARLQHPAIVAIHRVGQRDGRPYIVQEYVAGRSLASVTRPVFWRLALDLGRTLADGLAAAHARGVLHRDITAANVIVAEDGEPKLVDFGLARVIDGAGGEASEERGVAGTPGYIAPELWRGKAATAQSDVYALGAVLYELCAGRVPHGDVGLSRLPRVAAEVDVPALATLVPDVDPRFAAVVDRCLRRPPEARFDSAAALRAALDEVARTDPASRDRRHDCPYRGLLSFDARHRAIFFGREREVRELVERLRTPRPVVVAGESGAGKSSLVRAGLLPAVADGQLGDRREWNACVLVPGARPLRALARALASQLGTTPDELAKKLAKAPGDVAGALREHHGEQRGTVIVVDQLEELVTLSTRDRAVAASEALATLAAADPGVRVVATVRGDKVTELAGLPGLGAELERTLYILRPLGTSEVRKTIVGPAAAHGVRFESDAMVEALARAAAGQGRLPLVQFALSQLWEARDVARGVIPETALDDIGGVAGALSRHADAVVQSLLPRKRRAARTMLVRLVSGSGTSARQTESELVGGDPSRRDALARLVEGRLVVVRELDGAAVYEIAHEALIHGWDTLETWLAAERGAAAARARRLRLAAALAPLVLVAVGWAGWQYQAERERARERARLTAEVDGLLAEAEPLIREAQDQHRQFAEERAQALTWFREGKREEGEDAWRRARVLVGDVESSYGRASRDLEYALRRDPGRQDVRKAFARTLHERATFAAWLGRSRARDELLERLALYDDAGALLGRWRSPVQVSLNTMPAGLWARLIEYRRQPDGSLAAVERPRLQTPRDDHLLPGSYVLVIESDGQTVEVRYPFVVEPQAIATEPRLRFELAIPLRSAVPPGFVYVPAGEFRYGFGEDPTIEGVRPWHVTLPLHRRSTGPYLIARHETTYAEWIEYLRQLPRAERERRLPAQRDGNSFVELVERDGDFVFTFEVAGQRYLAGIGDTIAYPGRDHRQEQNWLRFPVTGISAEDAAAYARRLDRSNLVTGARLCREDEWERAARGADDRMFPHGDRLRPDDANYDETYGKQATGYGFDEVGSHPRSRSPFGADDMAGNAREMTTAIADGSGAGAAHSSDRTSGTARPVDRTAGTLDALSVVWRSDGYFFLAITNVITNRDPVHPGRRDPNVGFRICADWPPSPGDPESR